MYGTVYCTYKTLNTYYQQNNIVFVPFPCHLLFNKASKSGGRQQKNTFFFCSFLFSLLLLAFFFAAAPPKSNLRVRLREVKKMYNGNALFANISLLSPLFTYGTHFVKFPAHSGSLTWALMADKWILATKRSNLFRLISSCNSLALLKSCESRLLAWMRINVSKASCNCLTCASNSPASAFRDSARALTSPFTKTLNQF